MRKREKGKGVLLRDPTTRKKWIIYPSGKIVRGTKAAIK